MQSYDEWKIKNIFENSYNPSRMPPYIPHTVNKPIGNSLQGVPHKIGVNKQEPLFHGTAPSENSGGAIRNSKAWDNYMSQKAKEPLPAMQPQSPLGELGSSGLRDNTFQQDPISPAKGTQINGLKGQFESFKNYVKFRESGVFPGPAGQGTSLKQQKAPKRHPKRSRKSMGGWEMNPAAGEQKKKDMMSKI
jgi:hypothetical protein